MYFRLIGVPESLKDRMIASRRKIADVPVLDVARGVAIAARGHEILAGPLRHHDDGVAAALEPLAQRGEQPLEP